MKYGTNALRATVATLIIAGGIGILAPALAADEPDVNRGYVTDGYGNPISDASDNCVGDASLPEGTTRKCSGATPATPVAEPRKDVSATEA
ncbi:MAG: hypothetical protein EPN55_05335 [Gammaproteobacteria bacterium]|nr:MAG: hypothetical protein EPN55_05335 [Gammaproteobacteria bacterium]